MARLAGWERVAAALLTLAFAGNAGVYVFVLQPLQETQRAQQQHLLAVQARIRALQGQARALEAQVKALQQVEAYWEQFPEREALAGVTGELTRIAERLGLKLPAVTYQPEPLKEARLLRVRLTLGVEGRYEQLRRFLYELEKRRQYLVVERLGLSEQRGGRLAGAVVARLNTTSAAEFPGVTEVLSKLGVV